MRKTEQNGRSMIEMLGVLSIIGVLSVGGFGLVNKMQKANEVNKVLDELSSLTTKSRVVIRDYEGANGKINKYICDSKAIPDEFLEDMELADDGKCTNEAFLGSGNVEYNVYYLNDAVTFVVGAENVSEEACMQIATTNWGGPGSSGFVGMSVTGNSGDVNSKIKNCSSSDHVAIVGKKNCPAPMGIGKAANLCEDGVTVYLSFR